MSDESGQDIVPGSVEVLQGVAAGDRVGPETEGNDAPLKVVEPAPAAMDITKAVERLPVGMQKRLVEIVARGGGVAAVIQGVEEALPEFIRSPSAGAERTEHPSGEAFFTGEAGNLSDAEAEELARQQLERSGLLRGQRVRARD